MLNIDYILVILNLIGTLLFIVAIVFLINWRKLRRYVRPYLKYGISIAGIITFPYLINLYLKYKNIQKLYTNFDTSFLLALIAIVPLAINILFGFFVLIAVTIVGLYYASKLNQPQSPTSTLLDKSQTHYQRKRKIVSVSRINWIFAVLTVAVASVILQNLLYGENLYLSFPLINLDELSFIINMHSIEFTQIYTAVSITGGLILILQHEIFFRLGVQNALSVWWGGSELAKWIAIFITSVFYASFFCGFLISFSVSNWVRIGFGQVFFQIFFQVFIIGVGLGWLNKRYGIEASILASALTGLLFFLWAINTF